MSLWRRQSRHGFDHGGHGGGILIAVTGSDGRIEERDAAENIGPDTLVNGRNTHATLLEALNRHLGRPIQTKDRPVEGGLLESYVES